uniref:Uncharacterized protein n=1 Tax=Odontella aurita TaxID=265563 RepID=A0A7S4JLQ1_9STRA
MHSVRTKRNKYSRGNCLIFIMHLVINVSNPARPPPLSPDERRSPVDTKPPSRMNTAQCPKEYRVPAIGGKNLQYCLCAPLKIRCQHDVILKDQKWFPRCHALFPTTSVREEATHHTGSKEPLSELGDVVRSFRLGHRRSIHSFHQIEFNSGLAKLCSCMAKPMRMTWEVYD